MIPGRCHICFIRLATDVDYCEVCATAKYWRPVTDYERGYQDGQTALRSMPPSVRSDEYLMGVADGEGDRING